MAKTDNTTLNAAQVHPVLGIFSAAIMPHLPPFADTGKWEDASQKLCEKHGADIPLNLSPAEAWIAMNAIEAAMNAYALSGEDHAIALYTLDRLPEALIANSDLHTTADAMARIDWLIAEMMEHGCGSLLDCTLEVVRRIRWDAVFLMPRHGGVDTRPKPFTGPTVREMGIAVEAVARAGKDKTAAAPAFETASA